MFKLRSLPSVFLLSNCKFFSGGRTEENVESKGQRWCFQSLNRIILFHIKLYSGLSNIFFFFNETFKILNTLKVVNNFYFLGTRYQCTS